MARVALLILLFASPVLAQEQSGASKFGRVLLGGVAGFGLHETGHLIANWAFEERVTIKKVGYKGIPFFALSHAPDLSPRREYVVSSAGMWTQYLYSEQILTHHPNLKNEQAPFRKGMLAFHVVTSLVYSGAAFGKTGPVERDTRGMALSRRISERWIGAIVLAPALLDMYRYFNPDARWATWTSRSVKMGSVALVIR
ncbi:MAG TPA: hypothetical protein VM115_10535 [Vicinamibacterales bacterium]|nr:hypothetical protein [Vicinamibacterales bacterium]